MATDNSIKTKTTAFNQGMLKLEGAKALLSTIGIFVGESAETGEEMAITGSLLDSALSGIRLLIESAESDLMTRP
jgi:hypothetical protein